MPAPAGGIPAVRPLLPDSVPPKGRKEASSFFLLEQGCFAVWASQLFLEPWEGSCPFQCGYPQQGPAPLTPDDVGGVKILGLFCPPFNHRCLPLLGIPQS